MRRAFIALLVLAFALPATPGAQELVIVLEGTKSYHRPGCELIQGRRDVLAMQRAQAEAKGFTSHRECDPANVPPAAPPAKAVVVTVDEGGKYYHRDTCKKIGRSPRKISLEEAAKKHWPCPICKPPIRPRTKRAPGD